MTENPVKATLFSRPGFFRASFTRIAWYQPLLAALVLIVLAGGTSYAAEGALPGDALYGIKVNINEPIQGLAAATSEEKAKWNAARATRRLEEAEILAAHNKLNDETRVQVEALFADHTNAFSKDVATLVQAAEDTPAAATVQSDFEATLRAHHAILADLIAASSSQPERQKILAIVESRILSVATSRMKTDVAMSKQAPAALKAAAEARLSSAEKTLVETQKIRAKRKADTPRNRSFSALHDVEQTLSATTQVIENGKAKLSEGKFESALSDFSTAARAAKVIEVAVDANNKIQAALATNNDGDVSLDISATATAQATTTASTTPPANAKKGQPD